MSKTTIDELQVLISANSSKFQSEIAKVRENLAQVSQSARGSGESITGGFLKAQLALGALKGAFSAVVGVAKAATSEFGSLEQNLGGAEAVFGQFSDAVKQKSKESAQTMGTSMSQYLAAANKMGSLFQGAGYDVQKSMIMTTKAMQRAADVASVMGISQEAALESVAGMAKGNFTMMDNLGVAMNDTALSAYMLEKGIQGNIEKMTTGEKVGIAYQMFMDRTGKYAGNFARESMTLEGALAILRAELSNVAATLGSAFAPVVLSVSNFVSSVLIPAINAAIPYIVGFMKVIGTMVNYVISAISSLFGVTKKAGGALGFGGVSKAADSASKGMSNLGKSAGGSGGAGGMNKAAGSAKKLKKELLGLAKFDEMNVLKTPEDTGSGGGGGGAGSGGGGGVDFDMPEIPTGGFKSAFDEIGTKAEEIANKIKGFFSNMFDFPKISAAFGDFWEGLKTAGGAVFEVIVDIWRSYLKPFISWAGNDFLPAFLRATGAALEVLGKVISTAWNLFLKPFIDQFLVPIAKFTGGVIVSWLNKLTEGLKALSNNPQAIRALASALSGLLLSMAGAKAASVGLDIATLAFTKLGGVKSVLINASGALSAFNKGIISFPTLLSSLSGGFTGLFSKITTLGGAMSSASGIFGALGGVAKGLWAVLAANPIGAVVAVLGILFATNEKFRNGVMNLISAALKPLGELFANLMSLIDPLVKVVLELANLALKPLFMSLQVVGDALGGLLDFLTPIISVVAKVGMAFNPLSLTLKVLKPILEALGFALEKVGQFFDWICKQVSDFFRPAFEAVGKVIEAVKQRIDDFVKGLPDWAKNFLGVADSAKETKKANEELEKKNKDLKTSIDDIFEAENRLKNSRAGLAGSLAGLIESTKNINQEFEKLGMSANFSQEKLVEVGKAMMEAKNPTDQMKIANDQLGLSLDANNLEHLKQIDSIIQLSQKSDEYNAKLNASAINQDALTRAMNDNAMKSETVKNSFQSLISKFMEGGLSADQLSRKINDLSNKGDEDSKSLKDAIIRNADAFGLKWDETQQKMVKSSEDAKNEIKNTEDEKSRKIIEESIKAADQSAKSFGKIKSSAQDSASSSGKAFDGKGGQIGGESDVAKRQFSDNFARFGQIALEAWLNVQLPFRGAWSAFSGIGRNIWEGLKSGIGNIANNMRNMFSGAVEGVKKFLGIHSPSRLFKSYGGFVSEGFALGIQGEMSTVSKAFAKMTDFEVPEYTVKTNFDVDTPDYGIDQTVKAHLDYQSKLDKERDTAMDKIEEAIRNQKQQITVKVGEDTLVNKIIDGVNAKSFLENRTVFDI